MTQERIDIVVSEDGSRVVKRNLEDIGNGAKTSQTSVDKLNDTLSKTSGAAEKLKATGAAALESAKSFKLMEAAGLLLRGAVLALSAAVGAFIGAALLQLVVGMYQGWQQSNALRKELLALGGAAGDSGSAFEAMAQQVGASTGRVSDARAAVVALAQSGKVSYAQLKDLGQATVELAFLTGGSVESMASKLSGLGENTSKTVAQLNREYGLLNVTIYEQVRALEDQGRLQEAANLASKALADDTHERAVKAVEDMGWIERRLEMLRSAYDDFKNWTLALGRDATLDEQYQDSLRKTQALADLVKASDNVIGRAIGAHARNQAAYNERLKETLRLNKEIFGAGGEVQKSAEVAAQTQAGKDAVAASAAVHDMLERTGKLNVLQQKLNENTARYKIMWDSMKAGNAPSELLKGVTRDDKGNFSGGSYNDAVSAIVSRYSPKAGAGRHGLSDEEKDARKRQTYLAQLESSLEQYSGRASIAARAQNDLTNAQTTFDAAVKEGFITQEQANQYMEQLRIRTRDALDPLGALNRKIDEQTALMKLNADQQQVQATLMSDIQSLQARGQILTDKDIAQLRAKITAQQELGRIMQIQNQLQQGSQSEQDKNRGRGNQAVSNLLGDKSSGYTKDDAFNDMSRGLPQDVFAGTKEAAKQNVKTMQDMFRQIDDMRKLDVISEQSANMAKMNVWLSYSQQVAQSAAGIFGNLATLQNSSNKKAAAIGKSAAIAQALMNTYSGATAAFQSAAQIPYVGWLLAPAAAGAAIVAGMAQVAQIRSTPTGQGFAYGGEFTVGGVGGTDSQNVAFRATPGERVTINTPQQAQAIEDAARRRDDGRKRRGGDFKQTVIVNVKGKPDRKTPAQQARAIRHETMKEYSRS